MSEPIHQALAVVAPDGVAPISSSLELSLIESQRFFNRELSWLAFNQRVLSAAQDAGWPLLERVRFLSIFASNLDEFFMVRVAGLKQQTAAGVEQPAVDGRMPSEVLADVRARVQTLLASHEQCFQQDLEPALREQGITLVRYAALEAAEQAAMDAYFQREVFPLLTPLVVDASHPFTHIPSMSLNLALVIVTAAGEERFARVMVPATLPRLVDLGAMAEPGEQTVGGQRFVWLEELIAANAATLFPGTSIEEAHPFRIIRDADNELQEDEAEDLLLSVEEHIRQRRFGGVVGLFISSSTPEHMRALLLEHLDASEQEVYTIDGYLDLGGLSGLVALERPELKNPSFAPDVPPGLHVDDDLFSAIREGDMLLHHPYDSFAPIVDWLAAAAEDPAVLTIKQTLYRVGHDSPIVAALMHACAAGKQVAVLVELKARFDEASNIEWARALEQAGAQVVYGLVGLKTHSKVTLVVRREDDGLRSYVHIGTGNYNPATAKVYTDLSLLTCDPEIAADVTQLFNSLTGYADQQAYRRLLVAPTSMRSSILALIEREIQRHEQHGDGRLIFKLNALVDPPVIDALYRASQRGVQVDLVVRGICSLRPGVPGLSDGIRVRSIVGRFLEHSRIYCFQNGGDSEVYIGSADMMPRNLDRRVEVLCPVLNAGLRRYLLNDVLETLLDDSERAWLLQPDGSYVHSRDYCDTAPLDSQSWLLARHQAGGATRS